MPTEYSNGLKVKGHYMSYSQIMGGEIESLRILGWSGGSGHFEHSMHLWKSGWSDKPFNIIMLLCRIEKCIHKVCKVGIYWSTPSHQFKGCSALFLCSWPQETNPATFIPTRVPSCQLDRRVTWRVTWAGALIGHDANAKQRWWEASFWVAKNRTALWRDFFSACFTSKENSAFSSRLTWNTNITNTPAFETIWY